ncbi:alpha-acetolactate decarboxylase [Companilactobacillus sp. RD055328]|uniref:acetolactate decarboxylase n=1 Tax=Companilactobacillus sp. RD055328 TaxID=2916634 RepID=UPI001FC844F0|nr:acetolactate decarboxylase [Companilactobacillus sp. RD055328]GKQ42361.1 alpha-acetolactate decarboxylase [Companilactobacillus sp. RD055328]
MNNKNILYQHGTLALLVPGLLEGTITMGELFSHGDTGIGTGQGLDGELIMLDGVPYQIDSTGTVNLVKDDFTLPFATTHSASFNEFSDFNNLDMSSFEQTIIEKSNSQNTFFSVITKGEFSKMKTRAVAKSNKPYPTLVQTAKEQSIFESDRVSGTLLTYYSPEVFHGVAVGGCHSHFLADDHSIGGHVLDFQLEHGKSEIQVFDTLEQHLPINNSEYMNHNFDNDSIGSAIDEAEK